MERRPAGETHRSGGGRAGRPALLLLSLCAWFLASFAVAARAADDGTALEGSGIRYPGGYDANTVGEVRGTAHGLERPEHGPIRFRLDAGAETYTVLASPSWYWDDLRTEIPEGAEVKVRGSKTLGRDMALYIIAQEIRIPSSNRTWVFRDDHGLPLWKAQQGQTGIGGGSGSPMFRGGGGRGQGGMGGRGGR
ncbi:MAG: hypothetical protein ACM3L8_09465 [Verrucomicrobiota bacterium]